MVLTPFRAGTHVVVVQGDDTQGRTAPGLAGYDLVILGGSDYTVVSVANGIVSSAREEAGLGYTVTIRNSEGLFDIYSNLRGNGILLRPGDVIRAGQPIGIAGTTGKPPYTQLRFQRRIRENDSASNVQVLFSDNPSQGLTGRGEAWISSTASIGAATGPLPPVAEGAPSGDRRTSLPIFDPVYYFASYSDLRNFYGSTNYEAAKDHWIQYGMDEGRKGSLAFDPVYYLSANQDVSRAYGSFNYAGALAHWLDFGIRESRRGSGEFSPIYYLAVHPDVELAYGQRNFRGAINHYYGQGRQLGWAASDPLTESPVFQLEYYLANYSDLRAAFSGRNQDVEATRHWYFNGIDESRRGSLEFDSKFYLATNEDIRAFYGSTNYRGATEHYLRHGKAEGRIGADDRTRSLAIEDASIIEGDSGLKTLSFAVSLNAVYGDSISVNYSTVNGSATAGLDYISAAGLITFSPGQTRKTVDVLVLSDTLGENDEIFSVALSNQTIGILARSQAFGTILNDDLPVVTLAASTRLVREDSNADLVFSFTRTGSTFSSLRVNYSLGGTATPGVDYTGLAATPEIKSVMFAAGSATTTVRVTPLNDFVFEQDETVSLRLVNDSGYTVGTIDPVTGTILNEDLPNISLRIPVDTVLEDQGGLQFIFSRDGDTSSGLTVSYAVSGSAQLDIDYRGVPVRPADRVVTFAPGSASATLTVTPIADTVINEPNKDIIVTPVAANNYILATPDPVKGTIVDDDVQSLNSYTMGPQESSLRLLGTERINGIGNNLNNTIIGNNAGNRLAGMLGTDILTGGPDTDVFAFPSLADSRLGNGQAYDVITDFSLLDRIEAPLPQEVRRLTTAVGEITSVTEASISALLTATVLPARSVAAIVHSAAPNGTVWGTFIVMNDDRPGYQADTDGLVYLKDYGISNLRFVEFT